MAVLPTLQPSPWLATGSVQPTTPDEREQIVQVAIEAGVFYPNVGWQCKECPFRSKCWAWG